jgi:hypothetical protein
VAGASQSDRALCPFKLGAVIVRNTGRVRFSLAIAFPDHESFLIFARYFVCG